jgi:hypothetical protein
MSTVLLEGNIAHLSLFNLLQLIKLEQKTCIMTLTIKELQQVAKLYFKFGLIKHAELNKLTGKDAIYRLICWWTSGEFIIEQIDEMDIPNETVTVALENILIGSAKQTDDLADLRAVVPTLESKISFTPEAIYEIQNELNVEIPEWVPGFVMELPITFSLARFFDTCSLNDEESCNSLKYMLTTGILTPHLYEADGQSNSAIESLASIIMEYLGFAQSQELINEAIESLQIEPDSKPGFSQLLAFSDYVRDRISEVLDDDIAQEIEWRLRARITSLS